MAYKRIVISSGHGKYVRGASGIIDEVDEARKVTEQLAEILEERGVEVTTFHDYSSHSQKENLWTITDFHNAQDRDSAGCFNRSSHLPSGHVGLFTNAITIAAGR